MEVLEKVLQDALEDRFEKGKVAVPLGTRSKDGKYIKTDTGWTHIPTGHKSHKVTLHVEHHGKLQKKEIHGVLGRSHQEVAERAKKILQKLHGKYGNFTTHRLKVETMPDETFTKSFEEPTDSEIVELFEKAMVATNLFGMDLKKSEESPHKIDKDLAFELIEALVRKHDKEWESLEGTSLEQEEDAKMMDLVKVLASFSKAAKDDVSEVASIAVKNGDHILMGRRRDNNRWTLPGGHLDKGEEKEEGAVRELFEESGIEANPKELKHLGSEDMTTYTGKHKKIHAYTYDHQGEKPTTKNDPDKEVFKWEWIDTSKGLPKEIIEMLHSPKNLVLQKLKLLPKEDSLQKGRPSLAIGTERVWGGQKYVKHSDGWVAVGGQHHGKKMGAFTDEASHKDIADQYNKEAKPKEEEEKSKEAAPEEKKPVKQPSSKPEKKKTETPKEEPKETAKEESEDAPSGTPRSEAAEQRESEDETGEYAFARKSAFQNIGEDVKESARHKRNEWKGLEEAEASGTAAALVKRDTLLKANPIDYFKEVKANNYMAPMAAYLILKKFPPMPKSRLQDYYKDSKDDEVIQRVYKDEKGQESWFRPNRIPNGWDEKSKIRDITKGDHAKQVRKEYVDAFNRIREKVDNLVRHSGQVDPKQLVADVKKEAMDIVKEYREKDRYSETANMLIPFVNNALTSYTRKSTSVLGEITKFVMNGKEAHGFNGPEEMVNSDKMADNAKQVIEGASVDSVFGKSSGKKRFNPADLYVTHCERKGPEDKELQTQKGQENFIKNDLKLNALQWGNSVTDDERAHHQKQATMAFKDLTDILGLPEQMGSFNSRLTLAIGARGKGNAKAHYEPSMRVINLTRKGGAGSLAHEWGHFFDNIVNELHGNSKSGYISEMAEMSGYNSSMKENQTPTLEAVGKLINSPEMKEFRERLSEDMSEEGLSYGEKAYWGSTVEVWARSFEKYIGHKMEKEGRSNTYLAGVKPHKFWPKPEEMEKMAPMFDAIIDNFKKSEMLKKALDLLALGEALVS